MDLASFLKPGLSAVSGSSGMARRLAVAAVAVGLSVPTALAMSAAAPAFAVERVAPAPAPAVETDSTLMPKDIKAFREDSAPYILAAGRHGLDPEAFLMAVTLMHGLRDDETDIEQLRLAPPTGRKGEPVRVADRSVGRWIDLVEKHGAEAGVGKAVETLAAARQVEDGKRRKPLVEATVRRIVEMRSDTVLEAEILARELVAARANLPKDFPELNGTQSYMVAAFGLNKMADFGQAVQHAQKAKGKAKDPENFAYKVLDVSAGSNTLLSVDLGNGKRMPTTAAEFLTRLNAAADSVKDMVRGVIERTSASLEDDAPSGRSFG